MSFLERLFGGHHGRGSGGRGHGGGHGSRHGGGYDNGPGPASVICQGCRTANAASARFCQQCGNSLVPAACTQCGAQMQVGVKFCGQCGKAAQ